jgi:ADP-heptose:LPS heptosyltransferase
LLALAPCVDRAWAFPLGPRSPSWWRHWDVIRSLRRESFDLAFNFSGADRTIFLTALTGAKWRVAHLGGRNHFWKSLLIPHWVPRQDPCLPVCEQRRRVLAACGFQLQPARFDLRLSPEAQAWAVKVTPPGSIHFSINASFPAKEWPLEHWVALAQTLLGEGCGGHIVASGSAQLREQERLRSLAEKIGRPQLRILPSNLTVERLAAVLARCRLHVGADSGVLHLAMALGIPTVSIFREYAGKEEWLPVGPNHRHLTSPCECAVQNRIGPACQNASACLARISPAQVAAQIVELIQDTP